MASIGIAGAGVLGRLLAFELSHAGHQVSVYDPAPGPQARSDGLGAAGFTAAGMLSPLAELENAGPEIAHLGWRSIRRWRDISSQLNAASSSPALNRPPGTPIYFRALGSLLLAHGSDLGAAQRVLARLQGHGDHWGQIPISPTTSGADPDHPHSAPQALDRAALAALEPALAGELHAWLLPGEGQILPQQILPALCAAAPQVHWHWGRSVARVRAGTLELDDGSSQPFELAVDVRGSGARPDLPVRGVRGEVLWLHAPGVALARPARLLHPRHRVYIVPRPGDMIVIGASEIESEDRSPVSLRSAVELMTAAHSVLPELAEARIVHLETNLRPALPDNHPRTQVEPGLLRINGLFRHGWLIAPALVDDALQRCGLPTPIGQSSVHV